MLHGIMLLVMVHWFLISVTYLREISWLAILGAGLLFLLAWLKRDGLKSAFAAHGIAGNAERRRKLLAGEVFSAIFFKRV